MENNQAIKLACEIVKTLIETNQLKFIDKDPIKNILKTLESLVKGINDIDKKINS